MAHGDISGKARTDPSQPQAFGVCDAGGEWRQRSELLRQMEWMGPSLQWNGYLVCREHYDTPQEQLRPIVLPPDPVPVILPRSEPFNLDSTLGSATQYVLFLPPFAIQSEPAVLLALMQASGIQPPPNLADFANTVAKQNVSQLMLPANPRRNYMAIYNPANPELQISLTGPAVWGNRTNYILGPGEALLWYSPNIGGVPTGDVYAIGLIPNVPYYAWETPMTGSFLVIPFNGPGNLHVDPSIAPAVYSIALTAPYNLTANLPTFDGTTEGPWGIKDSQGISGTNPITILPPTGKQIDGYGINQPYILNFPYQSITFLWDKDLQKFIISF